MGHRDHRDDPPSGSIVTMLIVAVLLGILAWGLIGSFIVELWHIVVNAFHTVQSQMEQHQR